MVVSIERQNIGKKIKRGSYLLSPEWKVKSHSIPIKYMPFIMALFIFSIFINLSDSLWNKYEPVFLMGELTLPDEEIILVEEGKVLKASAPHIYPESSTHKGILYRDYKIQEDDRYSIIAGNFNISLGTLISVNKIEDGMIILGERLKIPSESGILYTVEKGDTLSSISQNFNMEIEEINRANNLINTVIHVGEELFLPGVDLKETEINRIIGDKFIIPSSGAVKNNYGAYFDPVTGLKNYNYGIDVINKKGTPVYAAKEGIVGNTSYNPHFGRVIQINHKGSMQSMYSCLDSIIVKPGERVQRGDLLGYMGNSGFQAIEHLQFSLFKNKEDVAALELIF